MGWRKRLEKARKLHRPSLKDWASDGLSESFPAFAETIVNRGNKNQTFLLPDSKAPQNLPVVLDAKFLSTKEFHMYETSGIPCVIRSIPDGYDGGRFESEWAASRYWSLEKLAADPDLRDRFFKCGEDDDGKSVKVKLKHFIKYLQSNADDSPLYIFDTSFEEDRKAKRVLADYRVPSYFSDDLFQLVSEARRPPYRWFLVGPERSGSTVHVDPLATSAWNTLMFGKKRWVLFPPHVPKQVVKGRGLVRRDEDDEAIHYFMFILPRIKRKAASLKHHEDYKDFACYEFTQNAGETCFIPHGWWHAVLNLTHTVGVTQNFCSERNFDQVWLKTRSGRKRMAWKWLQQLDLKYPHLAERARHLNERDHFRMKYDPEILRKRDGEDKRQQKKRKSFSSL
jgi:histone arginine demethylase JMJD6